MTEDNVIENLMDNYPIHHTFYDLLYLRYNNNFTIRIHELIKSLAFIDELSGN